MSLGYICGPLCGISFGTTQQVQVATNRFAPQESYKIRTPSTSQEWRTRVAFCHRYVPRVRVVFQPTLSVRVWCLTLDPLTGSRIILDGKLRLSPYRPSNWTSGTAILVHRIIDHNVVPVHCLKQLQSTAIHVVLVSKPVKILAVYLPLSRHIIDSKLSDWLCGSLPVLMAGNLNSKNVAGTAVWSYSRQKLVWLWRREFLSHLWADHTYHCTLYPPCHTWYPTHPYPQRPTHSSVSDHMVRTELDCLPIHMGK